MEPQKFKDVFKAVTKGDTYPNEDGDMYTSGIHIERRGNVIECHGNTREKAEYIRDEILTLIKRVKDEDKKMTRILKKLRLAQETFPRLS